MLGDFDDLSDAADDETGVLAVDEGVGDLLGGVLVSLDGFNSDFFKIVVGCLVGIVFSTLSGTLISRD